VYFNAADVEGWYVEVVELSGIICLLPFVGLFDLDCLVLNDGFSLRMARGKNRPYSVSISRYD